MSGCLIASFASRAGADGFAGRGGPQYACSEPEEAAVDPARPWAVLVEVPDRLCEFDEPGPAALADLERAALAAGGSLDRRRLDDPAGGYDRLRAEPPRDVVRRYA